MNLHSQQTREDRVPIWDINQVVFVLVHTQFDRNRLVKILLSEIQNKFSQLITNRTQRMVR